MSRKGYSGEYRARKDLEQLYPSATIIKIAIAQIGADYMLFEKGRLILLVEVKETIHDYFYESAHKEQLERIRAFAVEHNCPAELWIYYRGGKGKEIRKEIRKIN